MCIRDRVTPLTGVTGGGLPAEIWQAVMTEIHDGLPALPLSTVSPDGSGMIVGTTGGQNIVTSGSADDPLAAALAEALRDNQAPQQGTAPRTPGNTVSSGNAAPAPAAASGDDALSQALNGILGGGN